VGEKVDAILTVLAHLTWLVPAANVTGAFAPVVVEALGLCFEQVCGAVGGIR
jgi:hypothetical protein